MVEAYYGTLCGIAFLLLIFYICIWNRRFNTCITLVFVLVPIVNLIYLLLCISEELHEIILAIKLSYIGGCFLIWALTMAVVSLCKIEIKRWIRVGSFLISFIMYIGVQTIGVNDLFYKSIRIVKNAGQTMVIKEYGPLHTVFYFYIAIYYIAGICVVTYSLFKNKEVSRVILYSLFLPEIPALIGFAANKIIPFNIDLMPLSYVFGQLVYLFIVKRMSYYTISDMVIESMIQSGDTGFVTIDFRYNYLSSNETAKNIIPALRDLTVDQNVQDVEGLKDNMVKWISHFKEDGSGSDVRYEKMDPDGKEDQIYKVKISYLYDGSRKIGYQFFFVDDTQEQKYIALLDKYNSELEEEVGQKTEKIINMHNNLILSMATMVESRDNSTGGHIKRTSQGVRILIDEMKKDGSFDLNDEFCRNIIKAAPMHDLGKIAVDDAILRKPGRFTDEEYEKMKMHAPEGAKIVHEILKDTDDESFKIIAENVAHFHHERWDGSGYPDGISGENIPFEARIMAIADVYDALVSKRVYKEKMSFEKANAIIEEGMGSQFDPSLKKIYERSRKRLEEFYESVDN